VNNLLMRSGATPNTLPIGSVCIILCLHRVLFAVAVIFLKQMKKIALGILPSRSVGDVCGPRVSFNARENM